MRPMRILLAVFALVLMSTAVVRAQTYTELYSFCATLDGCPNGAFPISLIQATDGNFYGQLLLAAHQKPIFARMFQATMDVELCSRSLRPRADNPALVL